MGRARIRAACLALSLALGLCACSQAVAPAPSPSPSPSPAPEAAEETPASLPLAGTTSAERTDYPPVKLYRDGLLFGRGYQVEDTLFLCPQTLSALYGLELESHFDSEGNLHMTGDGLELTGTKGLDYMVANGRYLYTPGGWITDGDLVYLPGCAVEKLLGLRIVDRGTEGEAAIYGDRAEFLEGGDNYYELHYSEDDLYWLSHIINAEGRLEPLEGMIGVGNVVLNRVASEHFPDRIYDVVYDRETTVQFIPIIDGQVLAPPEELPVIATYLCLEGFNTVGDSLYFVNPDRNPNPWFERDLDRTVAIGHYQFYTDRAD